jgi:hypothetical protein
MPKMVALTRRAALTSLGAGVAGIGSGFLLPRLALAKGNLASSPVRLPELKIDTVNLKYSQTAYALETGKYYFWTVSCDGEEEDVGFAAPELFANSWINQIVADDIDLRTSAFSAIVFDDAASFQIQFVPLRPGRFAYYSPGFERHGLKGQVTVA